jgi:hypothetical protein
MKRSLVQKSLQATKLLFQERHFITILPPLVRTLENIKQYKNKKPNLKTVSSITTCATIRRDDNEQEHNEQNGVLPQDKQ